MSARPRTLRVLGAAEEIAPLADHSQSQLLTIREAAARLRVGQTLLYDLIKRGAIRTIRFPGSRIVRIDARVIQEFIDRGGAS